jgi:hypothetical protein
MLLKITHFPYVAAIWAYERVSRYLNHDDSSWRAKSKALGQDGPLFASRISSSGKARRAALTSRSDASLARTPNQADARPKMGADDVFDLKQMIFKLSAQVDELTSKLEQARR